MNSTEIELSQGGLDAACELLDLFEAFDAVDDSMYESPGYLNPPIVSIPLKYGLETDNWLQYIKGIKSGAQYNKQVELFIWWYIET